MKKAYIQPKVEVTEIEALKVVMASVMMGDDITSGNVSADAADFRDWNFFED